MSQKGIAVTFLQQFRMFSANKKTKNEFMYEIALNKKRLFFLLNVCESTSRTDVWHKQVLIY